MISYTEFVDIMLDGYAVEYGDMYYTYDGRNVYVTTDIGFTNLSQRTLYALYLDLTVCHVESYCKLIRCSRRYS